MKQEAGPIPQVAWQLYDASWQLIYLLQRTQEASASLQAAEPATPQRELGSLQLLKAGSLPGSLPFGIDRRLASLPVIGWQTGTIPLASKTFNFGNPTQKSNPRLHECP